MIMKKLSKTVCIVILVCLPAIAILYAKATAEPVVLVEALIVQVGSEASQTLGMDVFEPGAEVTIPVAELLWLLADANSAKLIASAKLKVPAGETAKVGTGEKVKFLIKKDDGSLEQKTTDTPIGTTLEATPVIDKDGDILLDFKFEHFSAAPAKEIDPQTSLPIGPPIISIQSERSRLKLKSGESMIAGGWTNVAAQRFVLVRATILE